MRVCRWCLAPVVGRGTSAKFCSHECLRKSTDDRAKKARIDARPIRFCRWCGERIDRFRKINSVYCCDHCQYLAEKKREREKIARYRAEDPIRYQQHRRRENTKRAEARAALRLINDLEARKLEALL